MNFVRLFLTRCSNYSLYFLGGPSLTFRRKKKLLTSEICGARFVEGRFFHARMLPRDPSPEDKEFGSDQTSKWSLGAKAVMMGHVILYGDGRRAQPVRACFVGMATYMIY